MYTIVPPAQSLNCLQSTPLHRLIEDMRNAGIPNDMWKVTSHGRFPSKAKRPLTTLIPANTAAINPKKEIKLYGHFT